MEIGQLREIIKNLNTDVVIYAPVYEIDEANEYVASNYQDEVQAELSKVEWEKIVQRMTADETVWQALDEAFNHYINKTISERKGK